MKRYFGVVITSFFSGILGAWFFASQLDIPQSNVSTQEWRENLSYQTSHAEERTNERTATIESQTDRVPDAFVEASEKAPAPWCLLKTFQEQTPGGIVSLIISLDRAFLSKL